MALGNIGFEQRLRHTLPVLLAGLAVLIDLAPRPAAGGGGVGPFLTLAVVYFWCVYRPDLMSYPAVFGIGLVYDLLSGWPLGCTALAFVLGRGLLIARQRFFYAKSFFVIWALFAFLIVGVEAMRWGIGVLATGRLVDPTPLAVEAGLTVVLYPALSWLLVRVHDQVLVAAHAES